MKVLQVSEVDGGVRYDLDSGEAVLMKRSTTCGGKPTSYPIHIYKNGTQSSAIGGRFSEHNTMMRRAVSEYLRRAAQ